MDNLTLGKKIFLERWRLGLSQKEFAERIGCSRHHLSKIEHDKHSPVFLRDKIKDVLGKDVFSNG